jgi:hypothetical protein
MRGGVADTVGASEEVWGVRERVVGPRTEAGAWWRAAEGVGKSGREDPGGSD